MPGVNLLDASDPSGGAGSPSAPADRFPLNPGTVEDLHKQAQMVSPMFFEGAKRALPDQVHKLFLLQP